MDSTEVRTMASLYKVAAAKIGASLTDVVLRSVSLTDLILRSVSFVYANALASAAQRHDRHACGIGRRVGEHHSIVESQQSLREQRHRHL